MVVLTKMDRIRDEMIRVTCSKCGFRIRPRVFAGSYEFIYKCRCGHIQDTDDIFDGEGEEGSHAEEIQGNK